MSIRSFRKAKGWTQEQLAKAIGVKRSVVSKYESGSVSPSAATIERIAQALDTTPADLMGWYEYPEPEPFSDNLTSDERTAQILELLPMLNDDERACILSLMKLFLSNPCRSDVPERR